MKFRSEQNSIILNGKWSFAYSDNPSHAAINSIPDIGSASLPLYDCNVPGNFELDLQANGIIDEPFFGMNIAKLTRYEKANVWYHRRFEADDKPGFDSMLFFEGLDCYADIYLNGKLIGSTDNMLVEHSFNVNGLLKGDNEILVHIRPTLEEAKKYEYPPSVRAFFTESLYIRKAPHMFGWDIMARAVSAGIWRPVKLQYLPKERLERVYLETTGISPDKSSADLLLHFEARTSGSADDLYELLLEGCCGESRFSTKARMLFDAGKVQVSIENPILWWPRGRGEASLYDVTVTLIKNGESIDRMQFTHGIRSVELVRTSTTDAEGCGEFCFKINGEKLFVLGTNWVPADAYHSRDVDRIPQMLELVEDIGCNMIRCWGGNVYENDLFYEICDRKGILVWQDFAMACGSYPQDPEFCSRLEAEARKVVRRLRQHPCIALWSGDNECDWAYKDPNKNVLTRQVLPGVIARECSGTPYLPSSPYIDEEAHKTGGSLSEDHLWGPRDYFKSEYYRNSVCHFASEMGYHGCPSPESISRFISPDKLWPYQNNEAWILHSTSPIPGVDMYDFRVELMAKQVKVLFGEVPDNLEDFSFASQVSQAEAMKFFVEFFRSTKWRRTGIIWWNIIDGWPQFSDAVVDYYFDRKLAYDYIKTSQQPVCLMLKEPVDGMQELVVCNDTRFDVNLEYTLTDVDTGETVLTGRGVAPADKAVVLGHIPHSTGKAKFYLIEWKGDNINGQNHYLAGNPPFDLETYRRWRENAGLGT